MFNLSDFKAKINKRQGLAKTNLFMVDIDAIGDQVFADGDLRFFCTATQLPGLNINTVDYRPRTFGLAEQMATGLTLEQASLIFMVDSKLDVIKFFHQWVQKVVNTNDRSLNAEVNGALPYELGYKDEFSGQMTIRWFTDNNLENYMEFVLKGVYPTGVSSINLSWTDTDQIAQLPVAFTCSGFESSMHINGSDTGRSNRSGLIEFITAIRSYGQAINRDVRVPSRVQNWIDDYTRIRNTVNGFLNRF